MVNAMFRQSPALALQPDYEQAVSHKMYVSWVLKNICDQ
jgi:hypothetical protein